LKFLEKGNGLRPISLKISIFSKHPIKPLDVGICHSSASEASLSTALFLPLSFFFLGSGVEGADSLEEFKSNFGMRFGIIFRY
jgi:hypothetical protein